MAEKLKDVNSGIDTTIFSGYSKYWEEWRQIIKDKRPVFSWKKPTERQAEALRKGENGQIPSGLSSADYRASLPDDKPLDR